MEGEQLNQACETSEVAAPAVTDVLNVGERLSTRNLIMYPLGTFGRDFLYNFFNGFLLMFVLLTKHLTDTQFGMITLIIILARIFDAFNDPIMGSIVENTRTKWGKYKPWQLIGVIIALFNVPLDGWSFFGFLAFAYFMFSITFTMNDISYWGMMPSLTSNPDDRNKLTSFTQLVCSAGGGLAGLLVPLFTVGDIAQGLGLGAVKGYGLMSVIVVVLMVAFQLFTILGVKEKPLPADFQKTERMKFKDLFKVLFKNDQLLWCTLVMLLWTIISGVAVGNLITFYIYFEFGYEGMLGTVFSIVYAVLSVVFTLFYPWFSQKLGRNRTLYSCGITLIVSYAILLIIGLAWRNDVGGGFDLLGMHITPKFLVMALFYGFTGWSTGFYMIMLINMANTVEYNEWKTGKRDEAIIFSLRPFTAKMGSALTQGVVSLVLVITGSRIYTERISELENIGTQTGQNMSGQLKDLIATIDESTKMKLLACMCIIPIVIMTVALIIYKAKCKLDEPTLAKMIEETEARKAAAQESEEIFAEEGEETPNEETIFVGDAPQEEAATDIEEGEEEPAPEESADAQLEEESAPEQLAEQESAAETAEDAEEEALTEDSEESADEDESQDDEDDEDEELEEIGEAGDGKKYNVSFLGRLMQAPDDVKKIYSDLKNVFLSYSRVATRVSWHYERIYIGKTKLARFVMRGKNLYMQLALSPKNIEKCKFAIDKLEGKRGDYSASYNLNGARRVQYAPELVALLMKSKGVDLAVRHKDKDFAAELPYADVETLVEKGLAKELKK